MDSIIIIEQVTVLAILMAVGFFGGRSGVLGDKENESMTTLLTKIAMPALTITAFMAGSFKDSFNDIVIVLLFSFIAHFMAAVLAKIVFMKYPSSQNKVLRFGTTFSNSGFMGLPFIHALFGDKALLLGSIYMIPMHTLLWTYGEGIMRNKENKPNIKAFLMNPAIIAILIGAVIFVLGISAPRVITQPISMISALTSPLAMLILGERMSKLKLSEIISDYTIYYASFIKLIVAPIIMVIIFKFVEIDPLIKNIIIIMQALPWAVMAVVLSQKHKLDSDLASKITAVSHALSIITIPIISLLL